MKQLHILSLFILTLCFATVANAQRTTPETNKKVVIIKKTIDENGEYVVEKIITTGDEVETVLREFSDNDHEFIHLDESVIKLHEAHDKNYKVRSVWKQRLHQGDESDVIDVGDGTERHVFVDINENDGEKTITIEIDGDVEVIHLSEGEELSEEKKQFFEEKGIHIMSDDGAILMEGDMVLHFDDIEVLGDDVEWNFDDRHIKIIGDKIHVITNRIMDMDFDFDFDHNFKFNFGRIGGINCAALGVYIGHGSTISSLIGSGGAEAAGLQSQDVITSINEVSLERGGLHSELSKYEPGDVVTIGYDRDGVDGVTEVTLTAWTDLPDFADSPRHVQIKCGESNVEDFAFVAPRFEYFMGRSRINCAALGVYISDGSKITGLIESGGAEAAGLQEGDVINGIDKTPISNHRELLKVLSEYEPGDMVTVDYERDGVSHTVQTALTAWTDLPAFADSPRYAAIKCGDPDYQNYFDFLKPVETSRRIIIIKKGQDEVTETEAPARVNQSPVETRSFDNSLELVDFLTFPNPTDGRFKVEFRAEPLPIVVSLLDVSGKEIFRDNMHDFDGFYSKEINITNEARGAFILSVEQNGKMFTEQVILH